MVGENMDRLKIKWWMVVIGILLAGAIAFLAWGFFVPAPMAEARAALEPDYEVLVYKDHWYVFQPILSQPTTGFIIYPGGRVDPRAYAPQAHAIAAQGYLVVIVPMPLHLAVFGSERAAQVIERFPEIQHWAIGGHSLGGAMAASFADKHRDQVQGLVLWAAYPSKSNDLSDSALKVTSISASLDGLATPKKIDASHPLLPKSTTWVSIAGGNHAQFGWYGTQSGDHPATITREEQQAQIIRATVKLLKSISTIKK
jgi:hypothetical protein